MNRVGGTKESDEGTDNQTQTYTCHKYSFTYRLYFLPANPCDTYKSAVRHIHDPMLVP